MLRSHCLSAASSLVSVLLLAGIAGAQQHPLLDRIADEVVQKYQQSTCEQLWQEKAQQQQGKPKTAQQQEFLQILRTNPDLRTEFINRVSAPIANKMFECGMIP
ncbi:MAG TPA: hypothetical protein VMJ66_08305 [Geobacteraceae bacterium]|nr:hypothetical protein [Geobacteraceae bacterium]